MFLQRLEEALKEIEKRQEQRSYAFLAGNFDEASMQKLLEIQKSLLDKARECQKPERLHVTMYFWLTDSIDEIIRKKVREWADRSIAVTTGPLRILGDERSLVLTLKSPELYQLQQEMDQWLQAHGVPPPDFPNFLAHTTICYGAKKEAERTTVPETQLTINRFVLHDKTHGDHQ